MDFIKIPWEFSLIRIGEETAGEIEIEVDVAFDEFENIEIDAVRVLLRGGKTERWVAAPSDLKSRVASHLINDKRFLDKVDEELAEYHADTPARIGDARYEDARA